MQTKGRGASILINDDVVTGPLPVSTTIITSQTLIAHSERYEKQWNPKETTQSAVIVWNKIRVLNSRKGNKYVCMYTVYVYVCV